MAETTQNIYKIGSKGDEVGKIQTALGDYYTKFGATVDNDYGKDTAGGVWDFQTKWNEDNPDDQIKVDGIVGPQTYPRLMQWHASKQTPTTPSSTEKKQPTTPVANQGEQQTTPTTGQEQQQTSTPTTNGAENPDNYTFTESELQAMEQQQTPQGGVVGDGVSSTHLYNYSDPGASIDKVLADPGNENKKSAILNDYFRWCRETGTPIDYFTVNAAIHNKDINKSPADDAKEQKRKERKEKWDKVGNFLLHLGNVVGNVAGGGMGSVKLEDPVQWSERQRLLKERTEQLQNSYNQSVLAQMTKQNADLRQAEMAKVKEQRDQQKLENDKRRLDYYEAESKRKSYEFEYKQKMEEKKLDYKKEKDELDRKLKARQISAQEHSVAVQELKAVNEKYKAENPVQEVRQVEGRGKNKKVITTRSRGNVKPASPQNTNSTGQKPTGINWVSKNKKQ